MAGEAVLSIVLEGLLSKLSSPILDEFGLLWGVKKEKQKLQSNLSRIKAVLEDAERQQIYLKTEKDRLRKLKDVAYDAEDLVDEFLVEALRRKVENQDGMGRKVGNFFSPSNPIAFRSKIAHKMKELRERFDDLAKENNNFQSLEGGARSQPQISTTRETASSVPDTGVQGRDDAKKALIDSLLYSGNEEVLSVIPIVGMGGLGKTTLAQFVYDDDRVVTHFNLRMWVYVSEYFHVNGVLGKILGCAINDTPGQLEQLQNRVRDKLSGNRYLLVLDDVWNEDSIKWDGLRTVLKCGAIGSKILVTTRSHIVARTMDALPGPPLKGLSEAESWTLFEEVAHPPTAFVSIGKEIVRKCGGVPLAIKTLGGMLRNETGNREWQSVRDSELWETKDHDGGILPALRLSYDHLTSSLKQCFAYCAVIPKGRRFHKDDLIRQWIAQGFIHSDDENELLEEGKTCFNGLLQRSLFQVYVETYGNYRYKMHDLIHDLLRSIAGKECLIVEASMMNDLTRHLALCNDETRHLALCDGEWAREPKNLDALKKCKKLRSMITYGYGGHIDINVCLSFRCLRVLDLSSRSIHFLPNSIDKLRHLRYFDISYTKITELPETICNLHSLQTLRVLGIRLQKWPKNMKRMISLRHLEFYSREYGMLSVVLEGLLSKLSSPILDEFGLLWGVKEEKQKLQSNLSRIKSVLEDAERQQIDLKTGKYLLEKLKDVAYDAEDLVDEFLVEARRRKVENQDGMGRKVGNFFSPSNPLAFHFKIAHKMKELRTRFDELAEENINFQPLEGVARSQPQISTSRETASSVPYMGVQGRDNEKEELIDLLLYSGNEEVLSVIPIVGMGGLGKTTLAQLVYSHERVVTHFGLRMWVYVSERDFHVKGFLGKILGCAINDTPDQLEQLQNLVRQKLSGKRYLLVLDDVWSEDSIIWDRLRRALECGAEGSKILVTTRSHRVARTMDALPGPPLGALSAAESWTLFEEVAHPPTDFVSIGKEIVRKCGGLPLAIKTLGGMLRNETGEREWQSVRDSELWKTQDDDGGILPALRLSYNHLTSSLKQCFVYCAVIPKGYPFHKDELIKEWIAQGFIHSDDENELLEEEGEMYFNALLRRSLFQVAVDNDSYRMHDLIHYLLRSVAGKECFIVEASMMNDLTRHLVLCNDETRHLALCNDERAGELKNLDALKKCKNLRSMITYGPIDINICLSFRCLRVLDLSGRTIHFLPNSIDKLRHLRYFDISYTRITELPETICNLHNLQTLRVLGIRLQKWPKNMKRMISLRHIEFGGWYNDFPLPKGIGELTFLRTLPKFIIAKESGAQIEELKDLNLLWGNIHIGGLDKIGSVGCAREADLKAKKHVNSLTLSWSGDETVAAEGIAKEVIEVLEPHSDLKELSVENYSGLGFPSWMIMKKLTKLNKISLSSCKRCEWLPPLGQLHFLESLEIDTMDAVKYIVDFDGSHNYKDLFPSLKDLHVSNMPNLEGWSFPQEDGDGDEQGRERYNQVIFKCLRTLKIHDCPKLARLQRLLLPALEELEMSEVGCESIEFSRSHSLKRVDLLDMPNLERWSIQEADDDKDEQVTFRSLCTLRISKCPKLICLPQLLPALEKLNMEEVGCEKIEFSASKSLKKVELTKMPNLERWSPQEADDDEQVVFHRLLKLFVHECPKMVRLPHFLPSLEKLVISESNEMLLLSVANYTSLSKLFIEGLPEVKHLPDEFGPNHTSLRELRIENCPKLISLSNQLENLLALKKLAIKDCNDLVLSLPDGLQQQQRSPPLNSLEVLEISHSCEKQTSLPGEGIVLPYLKESDMLKNLTALFISDSPKVWSSLVSLENLKSLERLLISGCPESVMMKLLESAKNLTSLVDLFIEDCPDMRSLPECIKTLSSLTDLTICKCPDMRSLPEWVGDLTLLRDLSIEDCPGMMSLPEGLQRLKNLKSLIIRGCPVLERRVRRNKGQDWHKVAHVPDIDISGGIAGQDTEGEESSDQRPHLLLHSLK